ncbi:MAE_28990/MAE_18760 family HEPN-like nuclease [Acetobacter sp.]|uniref:MAE_28990/MAE_18760 family HEPN-like nuclease n=1 Tax=Acetobacter sp. TaxID=440 RepID=UPI0039EA5EDB
MVVEEMRDVLAYLVERESEFARHLSVARMLEARVNEVVSADSIQIEVRHVNTLKSGLLIHLYNIVEAVATRTLTVVGRTVVMEQPKRWTESVLKEWVRAAIWNGDDRVGEGALARLTQVSGVLAAGGSPDAFVVKGEPGSWDDEAIKKIAKRLGCPLVLTDEVKRAAYERVYRDETTALKYLARRRNDIAHGQSTFEEGAHDLTLDDLAGLANRVLPFLTAVTKSYEKFLSSKGYLTVEEVAA